MPTDTGIIVESGHIEGFEVYGDLASLQQRYVLSGTNSLVDGRAFGNALKVADGNHFTVQTSGNISPHVSFAFKVSSLVNTELIAFSTTANTDAFQISLNSNGQIVAYCGGRFIGSSWKTIQADTWYHLEVKLVIHETAGSVEVRLNQEIVIKKIGVNTYEE